MLAKPKIAITVKIPQKALQLLQKEVDVVHYWKEQMPIPRYVAKPEQLTLIYFSSELIKWCCEVDGLYCISSDLIKEEILGNPDCSLKAVSSMSVGYDHIDLTLARKKGYLSWHY